MSYWIWCGANARFAVAEDGEVRDRETPKGHAYGEFYYEACDLAPDELQCIHVAKHKAWLVVRLVQSCQSSH